MDKSTSASDRDDYYMPRGTGIWIVLASLLLNCFLLGLLVAPMLHHRGPLPLNGPHSNIAEHLTEGLSAADAKIVHDAFQDEEAVFNDGHAAMEKAMFDIATVLKQPTVNADDLEKAQANVAASHAKFDQAMDYVVKKSAANLSPEGRQQFAASLERPPVRGHEPHDNP